MPTAQEVRSWYNRRYASLGLDSMRPFEAYPPVLELLAVRAGATLLDVSCGSGFLLKAARERGLAACGSSTEPPPRFPSPCARGKRCASGTAASTM